MTSILRVAARILAMEHATDSALKHYLKEHPKADRTKHQVRTKGPEKDSPAKAKGSELKGVLKPDATKLRKVVEDNASAFDAASRVSDKELESFESKHYESQKIGEEQNPGLYDDTRDLLKAAWTKMPKVERAIHLVGHKVGQHFEKGLSKAERKMHDHYFDRWRVSVTSHDMEGYERPEDYDHTSQELQGLVAALGVKGSLSPEDKEADSHSKGGLEKARAKAAKDPKLATHVEKMYAYQQAYFQHAGVKEVTLYRGVRSPKTDSAEEGDSVSLEARELSSFTADPNIAKSFGRAVAFKVPVEKIFASSLVRPGIGSETFDKSFKEAEFLVMGASELTGTIASRKASKKTAAEKGSIIKLPISDANEAWLQATRENGKKGK
jgi:hypothetical protein